MIFKLAWNYIYQGSKKQKNNNNNNN